jgi:hypothetical protein
MASDSPASIVVWLATPMRSEVEIRIEADLRPVAEVLHQRLAAHRPRHALDVVHQQARLLHVAHDNVHPAGILFRLAGGGLGLLVVELAVDQGGVAVAGVLLDALPDVEHAAAGGVDQDTPDGAKALEVLAGDAEGGEDHHVLGGDPGEVEVSRALALRGGVEEPDPHLLEALVDVGVVDDLADEEDAPVGKLVACLVGVVDRAVDAVAEAEGVGEANGDAAVAVAEALTVAGGADAVDDGAVVLRLDQRLDLLAESEPAAEVG